MKYVTAEFSGNVDLMSKITFDLLDESTDSYGETYGEIYDIIANIDENVAKTLVFGETLNIRIYDLDNYVEILYKICSALTSKNFVLNKVNTVTQNTTNKKIKNIQSAKCFKCGHHLDNVFSVELQPFDGLAFTTYGHYGSGIFDPINKPEKLDIAICDLCILKNISDVYGSGKEDLEKNKDFYLEYATKNRGLK